MCIHYILYWIIDAELEYIAMHSSNELYVDSFHVLKCLVLVWLLLALIVVLTQRSGNSESMQHKHCYKGQMVLKLYQFDKHFGTSCRHVMLCYVRVRYVLSCCYVMLSCVMLCCVTFHYIVSSCVVLCQVLLCFVMYCYVSLCHVILCCAVFHIIDKKWADLPLLV